MPTIDLERAVKSGGSRLEPDPSTQEGEPEAYVGLSTFNVPVSCMIDPQADKVVIRWEYPDGEPAERELHDVDPVIGLRLRLGQHTKKIIEIHVGDLERFFVDHGARLDPDAVAQLADNYPSRMQKVLQRNARLLSRMLGAISPAERQKIVHLAGRMARRAREAESAGSR